MNKQHDVIVVGLGAIGSALTCALAQHGAKVLGIDRFHPPHDHGSSHGLTRITRLAVGEGAAYVPLAMRSHERWRELEALTGRVLYRRTGMLMLASPGAALADFHGQTDFFGRTEALARQFGIAHERLDAAAVRERFPAFAMGDGDSAYFEPDAGLLHPEVCIAAQLDVARRHGAELRVGEPMLEVAASGTGASVRTAQGAYQAARVVLCTGAWLPGQVGGPLAAPRLRVLRQVLHWFATEQPGWYDPAHCPVFIWLHGPRMEDAMYGFPMGDGQPGVKVATEQTVQECDPDAVDRTIAPAEVQAMFEQHLQGRLRGLLPRTVHGATCLYTMAADGGFVVDRHPRLEPVMLVSPCSGHGFKHSAGLGEAIAQQLLGETPFTSLAPFALNPAARR